MGTSNFFETECQIRNELKIWESENSNDDFKIISFVDNKILIYIRHEAEHIIKLECPINYPKNRKGFNCREIGEQNEEKFSFIIFKASTQYQGKVLSIIRILTHLHKTLENYKLFAKKIHQNSTNPN